MSGQHLGAALSGRRWALILATAGAAIAAGGLAYALRPGGDWSTESGFAVGLGLALALGGAVKAWRIGQMSSVATEGGRREVLQRQRSRQLVVLPALMVAFLGQAAGAMHAVALGQGKPHHYLQILVPVLYGWVIPAIVMGWDSQSRRNRRFLEDEFTQSLRVRALIPAFVTLMSGTTAAFALGLWRPGYGVVAIPMVLAVSGAVAGLRFAWLDREAERG